MMNYHYLLGLSYFGHYYYGSQKQKNCVTVQGVIEESLKKLLSKKKSCFKTILGGRTDRGVHCLDQILKISLEEAIPADALLRSLENLLPIDIHLKWVKKISADFHPLKNIFLKRYTYLVSSRPRTIFEKSFTTYWPYLDQFIEEKNSIFRNNFIQKLEDAQKSFLGTHSFHHFFCEGSDNTSFVRTISCVEIKNIASIDLKDFFTLSSCSLSSSFLENGQRNPIILAISFEGDGFLKQMVRCLVGSLMSVGEDKITKRKIQELLTETDLKKINQRPYKVAGPNGLFLEKIYFKSE